MMLAVLLATQLTLPDALQRAREQNRQLAIQQLEVEKAADQVSIVRTKRLPQVNVNVLTTESLTRLTFDFERGFFGVYPGIGPIPASDTKLTIARTLNTFGLLRVGQPLTKLHDISIATRLAQTQRQIEEEKLRGERQRVAADVRRLYYGVLQAEAGLAAAEESVKLLTEVESQVSRHVEQQTALRADLLDVHARLVQARTSERTLRNSVDTAKQQMNVLLGLPVDHDWTAVDPGTPLTDVWVDPKPRPDVRQVELRSDQAKLDLELERAKARPDISLLATYVAPTTGGVLPRNIAAIGVVGSWEPFTWGRRRAEVAVKQKTAEQAMTAVYEARAAATLDLAAKRRRFEEANAAYDARKVALEATRERLRIAKEKFAVDATLLQDVLQREAAVAEANAGVQSALADYWSARVDLERAAGDVE